jgi:hypothetical protein
MIRTPILEKVCAQGAQGEAIRAIATHPIGRIGEPEEVASMVAYLSCDEAGFLTGGACLVDGGRRRRGELPPDGPVAYGTVACACDKRRSRVINSAPSRLASHR